ncbi:MAG: hypothetical protein IIY20_02535 [Bifidobacteriaceae bacterium]|nr:hypothetical protein [Bifidobacteriaceae bacterium]
MNKESVEGFVDLDRLESISAASGEAEERTLSLLISYLSAHVASAVLSLTLEVCRKK